MQDFELFKEIAVWRQIDADTFYRYRGFQNLKTGKYCFFACDHIHRANFHDLSIQNHQDYAFRLNLFTDGLTTIDQSEFFDSIEKAIADLEDEYFSPCFLCQNGV